MKNKTTIFIVAQIIIIIVLIWVIVLLANKDNLGNHSDEGESEEEIIVDYTTIVDGIKQIQLPSAVEKNSNIQYKKLEETKTNQKKLNYGIVQNISTLISAKANFTKVNYSLLNNEEELAVIRLLYDFPAAIEKAAKDYKPHHIANHLITLSQAFNEFYHKCPVISERDEQMKARLLLVDSVRQVLENGLGLLGIKAPDEM